MNSLAQQSQLISTTNKFITSISILYNSQVRYSFPFNTNGGSGRCLINKYNAPCSPHSDESRTTASSLSRHPTWSTFLAMHETALHPWMMIPIRKHNNTIAANEFTQLPPHYITTAHATTITNCQFQKEDN